jgi:MoaA/NifB/PqqE/SkfB family radical SAM enzyme
MKIRNKMVRLAAALRTGTLCFELDLVPLRFEKLPLRKIANWLLTETSVKVKPSRPWGLPTILQVEPTSHCNLQCRMCPVGLGLNRPTGNMSQDVFCRIVDELGQTALVMMFWDWGEPFLNPAAYEMIRYARQAGMKLVSSTNGHVFADPEQARQVVESGLDVLVFSVDGMTQETYQVFRKHGKLAAVLQGIENVAAEKRRSGSRTPVVNLRFIVMNHCEHEVPQVASVARGLGADIVTFRKFHYVPGTGPTGGIGAAQPDPARRLIPTETQYQLPALDQGGRPVRVSRNPCRNLWNCPTIHWTGTVCSCFMDYNELRPVGSLATHGFREIWKGSAYRNLRTAFRNSWENLPLCGDCASGFRGGDVGKEANAGAVFLSEPGE